MANRTRIPAGRVDIMRNPGIKGHPYDVNDVMVSYQFHNRTDRTLRITNRNGVSFDSHPVEKGLHNGELIIYVVYKAKPHVIKNMAALLYSGASKTSPEAERIYRALKRAIDENGSAKRQLSAVVEYAVREESIDRMNNRFYVHELDFVLEDPSMACMVHPFQTSEMGRRDFEALIPAASDRCFMLSYRVIDNSGQRLVADRYVNIGGEVFRIPVEVDPAFKNGIHVAKRNPISTVNPLLKPVLDYTHYTFEEGDKLLGLFISAEQAKAGGSPTDLYKEQLTARTNEDKIRTLELERELQEMRNELNKRKLEADLELNPGKTTLEWLKVVAGVGATLVTIYTLWQKVKPVKPAPQQPEQQTRASGTKARNNSAN